MSWKHASFHGVVDGCVNVRLTARGDGGGDDGGGKVLRRKRMRNLAMRGRGR